MLATDPVFDDVALRSSFHTPPATKNQTTLFAGVRTKSEETAESAGMDRDVIYSFRHFGSLIIVRLFHIRSSVVQFLFHPALHEDPEWSRCPKATL